MPKPDRLPFRCPLCASTVFERVTVRRPSGATMATEFYECAGCSVMFRDPERFTGCERFQPGREYGAGSTIARVLKG